MRAHTALGLVVVAALLISSAACSEDGARDEAAASRTAATTAPAGRPVSVTYARPGDVLAMVLPSTGAQTRLAQGYGAFQQAIAEAAVRTCLAPRGVPPPDGPPPMFIRFNDIPDLAFIEAHGFTVGSVPPPTPASTGASRTPASGTSARATTDADVIATQRECLSEGAARVLPLRRLTDGLRAEWLARLSSVDADPAVRTAYRTLPTCLRQRGVDAADEDAFFRLVDAQSQSGTDEHDLAVAYATCMRPIETVREPLRARVREQVVAARPAEAARVRLNLVSRIDDEEKRYGIRLCFPVD